MSTTLQPLLEYVVQHPEQTGGIATALGATAIHYAKTGRFPIGRLPFRALQDAWGDLADSYFGKDRPRGVPALVVSEKPSEVKSQLRTAHFESPDDYSFEYEGEVLNMRRPSGLRQHPDTGETVPMELHPRGFETDTGDTLVLAHDEASRLEAWGQHWRGSMLSWERGREQFAAALDDLDLDYQEIESERAAGIDVTST